MIWRRRRYFHILPPNELFLIWKMNLSYLKIQRLNIKIMLFIIKLKVKQRLKNCLHLSAIHSWVIFKTNLHSYPHWLQKIEAKKFIWELIIQKFTYIFESNFTVTLQFSGYTLMFLYLFKFSLLNLVWKLNFTISFLQSIENINSLYNDCLYLTL